MLSDAAPRALDDGSLVDGVRRSNLDTGHKRYDTRSLQVLVYQFLTVYGRQYVYRTYPCLPRVLFLIQSPASGRVKAIANVGDRVGELSPFRYVRKYVSIVNTISIGSTAKVLFIISI